MFRLFSTPTWGGPPHQIADRAVAAAINRAAGVRLIVVEGPRKSGRSTWAVGHAIDDESAVVIDEFEVQTKARRLLGRRFRVAIDDRALGKILGELAEADVRTVVLVRLSQDVERETIAIARLDPARVTRVRTFHPVVTEEPPRG